MYMTWKYFQPDSNTLQPMWKKWNYMEIRHSHTWLSFCSSFPDIMDTSLIRSPAVFKLEKVGIGFKTLGENFHNFSMQNFTYTFSLPVVCSWHSLNLIILWWKDNWNKRHPSFNAKMQRWPRLSNLSRYCGSVCSCTEFFLSDHVLRMALFSVKIYLKMDPSIAWSELQHNCTHEAEVGMRAASFSARRREHNSQPDASKNTTVTIKTHGHHRPARCLNSMEITSWK